MHRLWTRPVHIETTLDGVKTVLSYDGSEHTSEQNKASKA
jgi:stage V sporulation protein R